MAKRTFSLLALVVCFLMFVSMLCGCNVIPSESNGDENNNSGSDYKLTVQDPNGYLIENLEARYKAGEEVTVKTEMLADGDLIAYLDGVSLGLETQILEKGVYYWEFYFTMPSKDAVLSFSLSDGLTKDGLVLEEDIQSEIISSFVNIHSKDTEPVTEDEISLRCYGAFDGVYVLFVDVASWGSFEVITTDIIAGVEFVYSNSQTMIVYSDNAFYEISEAYDNNFLSYDNLVTAQQIYKFCHISLYR